MIIRYSLANFVIRPVISETSYNLSSVVEMTFLVDKVWYIEQSLNMKWYKNQKLSHIWFLSCRTCWMSDRVESFFHTMHIPKNRKPVRYEKGFRKCKKRPNLDSSPTRSGRDRHKSISSDPSMKRFPVALLRLVNNYILEGTISRLAQDIESHLVFINWHMSYVLLLRR